MPNEPKGTCSECGATMLASTAARTGGLCMACKQGIRASIEAAKAYYQKQRQPDAFRDYWIALVHRVYDETDGFYRLSHYEQTYFLGTKFEAEVYNGGIDRFFTNSSGNFYDETLDALIELGAVRCHALLLAARKVLFPDAEPPRDRAARLAAIPAYPDEQGSACPAWVLELRRIDKELWTDPDKLHELSRKYALDHQLVKI